MQTFIEAISPNKKYLKYYLLWVLIQILVLFFTYTHLVHFEYKKDLGYTRDKYEVWQRTKTYNIWLINIEPRQAIFWPFHSKWTSKTINPHWSQSDNDRGCKTYFEDDEDYDSREFTFNGIFAFYDISEFWVYTIGPIIIFLFLKAWKYLSGKQ
jgi:hypothetical protein